MKTTRGLMGAALFGSVLTLAGCGGSGTYQIPDVAPVVKQKPDDNLLEDIEGTDKPAAPAAEPPKAEPPKAEPKAEPPKAAEPAKPKPAKNNSRTRARSLMNAVVLDRVGGPEVLEYRPVADPVPEPDDVLVRVRAAGVCGRDLIDRRGGFPGMLLPAILGHEFAGEVVSVGAAVTRFSVGDRVANLHRPYCGDCDRCQEGETPDCTESWQSFGQTVNGGYAETVRAHHRSLVPIPDAVSFVDAAPLGCTAAVALRALRHEGGLTLGETVLITGATGGVGMEAIQIAKHLGARVIALTSSPETKTNALLEAGADHVVSSADPGFHGAVRAASRGGVDVALELTGSATFAGALRSLRARGRLIVVGNIKTEKVAFNPGALILFSQRISGSHGYTAKDLTDCLELVATGKLRMIVDRTMPLSEAAHAHRLLAERGTVGRLVLIP